MEISKLHEIFISSSGVSTDTRKIKQGSLFFALKGEQFDANDFAAEALAKGASYAVVDRPDLDTDQRFIFVENALKALQELSTFHRNFLRIPVLSLTGSNGKTTTKELINAVLSKKFKTTATDGNLNNHIGVPLTLLKMTSETEIGIVEMGANHLGEIKQLCQIARPDFGLITNFGKAHLEGFGSTENIVKGKKELFDWLEQEGGMAFLNLDDPLQAEETVRLKHWGYGSMASAGTEIHCMLKESLAAIESSGDLIQSQLTGLYNAYNLAAAYAVGSYFNVEEEDMKRAMESYVPKNNRSQLLRIRDTDVILDAYNANPSSMKAAIENFRTLKQNNKFLILGDMFELGKASEEEHQRIADLIRELDFQRAYLIGNHFYKTEVPKQKVEKHKDFEGFRKSFQPDILKGGIVLIKGSRGMALERSLELIESNS